MKKVFLVLVLVSVCLISAQAQWEQSLGVGGTTPFTAERPLHLRANNAIMRIDRNSPDPGLIITRFSPDWTQAYKSFYFYTLGNQVQEGDMNGNGRFVIADWGTNVSGPDHTARFVIGDNGNIGIGDYAGIDIPNKLTILGDLRTVTRDADPSKDIEALDGNIFADGSISWKKPKSTDGSGGLLSGDMGASIELRGVNKTPYIDFVNDVTTDFDMRFILDGDDQMKIVGGDVDITGGNLKISNGVEFGQNGSSLGNGSMELREPDGYTFIDFSNDATSDFDIRLICNDKNIAGVPNKLFVDGGDFIVRGGDLNVIGDHILYVGTSSPGPLSGPYKLFVEGGIRSEKVKVDLKTGWADYVFEDEYDLRPLTEVESFIQKNNHLPDVPSAVEVEENGIDVAEMDATLLRKIEELTLYVIELQKQNKALQERVETLEKK